MTAAVGRGPDGGPVLPVADGLVWSACVRDTSGRVLWQVDPARVLRTASIGKIILLLETARLLDTGELDPAVLLPRGDDPVGDSGFWHTLATPTLPLGDVAALIGAVSDNLATNVLLRHVGLDAVDRQRVALGLVDTRLLDEVRDQRLPTHPPTLSRGRADELSDLVCRVATTAAHGARVRGWLSGNTDLSMVASAFDLDPLAHRIDDQPPYELWNKTGTSGGVRADIGWVAGVASGGSVGPGAGPRGAEPSEAGVPPAYGYAVLATWDPDLGDRTATVLAAMREIGVWVRHRIDAGDAGDAA